MLKLDLHVHSHYSEDAIGTPQDIISIVRKRGLHGIAITDHNTADGVFEAQKNAPKDFIIIPGVEISTANGHLIALNISSPPTNGLPVSETVEYIIENGGLPIVPHLLRSISGIKKNQLMSIYPKISAIEVFNGCSPYTQNIKTAKIAHELDLGGTGGSDSHHPDFAGTSYTTIDSTDLNIDTILSEIQKKKTWGEGTIMPIAYRQERIQLSIKKFIKRGFRRI